MIFYGSLLYSHITNANTWNRKLETELNSGIIVAVVLASMLAFNTHTVEANHTTIIVPDDYPTIQAAMNAASQGDTIYVKTGTYYENVIVNKPLTLVGESKENTIVDGSGKNNSVVTV